MANITGNGAPTKFTAASPGDVYTNSSNGLSYKCTSISTLKTYEGVEVNYDWVKITQADSTGDGITTESDPTVPEWAKQATKPSYTAKEVGAIAVNDDFKSLRFADQSSDKRYDLLVENGKLTMSEVTV